MEIQEKIVKVKIVTPSEGKVLKNIKTNEYIMKVMGVNIDNFIEVPIEEYENWKLENNSKDNKTVI